jgi:hypothetical protein
VRHGLVNEITVLSPDMRPAEPLARVLTFSSQQVPPKTPAAAATRRHVAGTGSRGDEVILGGATLIRRPCGTFLSVH